MRLEIIARLPAFFLVLAFVAPVSAASETGKVEFPLEVFELIDDKMVVVFLKTGDVRTSPAWRPGESAPPLDLETVVKLALRDHAGTVRIREIKLTEINDPDADHRWYYLVRLIDESGTEPTDRYVAVLMNGKVFPGLVQPQAIK